MLCYCNVLHNCGHHAGEASSLAIFWATGKVRRMVANHPSKESQGLQMKLTGKPIPAMNCRLTKYVTWRRKFPWPSAQILTKNGVNLMGGHQRDRL